MNNLMNIHFVFLAFYLCRFLDVELQGKRVNAYGILLNIAKSLSIDVTSFAIPSAKNDDIY